jgi:hypothetical protein
MINEVCDVNMFSQIRTNIKDKIQRGRKASQVFLNFKIQNKDKKGNLESLLRYSM